MRRCLEVAGLWLASLTCASAAQLIGIGAVSGDVYRIDTDSAAAPVRLFSLGANRDIAGIAYHQGKRTYFAYSRRENRVDEFDLSGRVLSTRVIDRSLLKEGSSAPRGLVIDAQGRLHVVGSSNEVFQVDLETGRTAFEFRAEGLTSEIESLAPLDNEAFYAVGVRSQVFTLDRRTGQLSHVSTLPVGDLDSLTGSIGGWLFMSESGSGNSRLHAYHPVTRTFRTLGAANIEHLSSLEELWADAKQPLIAAMASSASAQVAPDARPWGEAVDGLQLNLTAGPNTVALLESRATLAVSLALRNVSDKPAYVAMAGGDIVYDYEYEFDGTWYAFDPSPPVRTSRLDLGDIPPIPEFELSRALRPLREMVLLVPIAGRSPGMQLHAITANGAGKRFEPGPGPHVVRVRPGRAMERGRRAPVSNAVTIDFRLPANFGTANQQVTFVPASDTPLRTLNMARTPAADQALIRSVLDRPPNPGLVWQLTTTASIQVMDPLPWYEMRLQKSRDVRNPGVPGLSTRRYYLLQTAEQGAAYMGVESRPTGSVLSSSILQTVNATPVLRALQQLAGMERVRGGGYEPRLVQVSGVRGTGALSVLWLHSAAGRPDLFFWPRPESFSGRTRLEADRIYLLDELIQVAGAPPVEPRHDEAWALTTALACVKAAPEKHLEYPGQTLFADRAEIQLGFDNQQDHVVWYVFLPGSLPPGEARKVHPPGTELRVNESDGSCQ
jgi:hypothetical protein